MTLDEAIDLYYRGHWAKAAEALPPAIEAAGLDPSAIHGWIALGLAQWQLLKPDDTNASYDTAISRSTDHPALHGRACWEKAIIKVDGALVDRAIAAWRRAGDPESQAWALLAEAYKLGLGTDLGPADAMYAVALPALDAAIGENDRRLFDVYTNFAAFHDRKPDGTGAAAAHAARVRAFEVAQAFAGPSEQVTINMAYYVAQRKIVEGLELFDRCIAATKDDNALALLWYARSAALAPHEKADALRGKEISLTHRERALGIFDHSLIPNRNEIKDGWKALDLPVEAEEFLLRCRSRAKPEDWVYRNLTYDIGYLLAGQQRRDEYAKLWKDWLAAREAACGVNSTEALEAVDILVEKLLHYVPAEEMLALSERSVNAKPTREALRGLAKAQKKAGRNEAAFATWKRVIDMWIEDLRAGKIDHEPAAREWVSELEAYGYWPTDDPPNEKQLAAAAVYDDAISRAVAIIGDDHPALATLFRERGGQLSMCGMRVDEALADLERAKNLFEREQGPIGKDVCYTLYMLSDHHDKHSPRDVAIAALRLCITARTAAKDFEGHYDRARLADWLAAKGDFAEALVIREGLVVDWPSGAPGMVADELGRIVRLYIKSKNLAKATATCGRFAGAMHHFGEHDRRHIVDAWWELAQAKVEAGDIDGAKTAIDSMVALWNLAGTQSTIESHLWMVDHHPPIADHLREKVTAAAFSGVEKSRELEASLAPELTADVAPILADALTSNGDPRGELIVVQLRLANKPDDDEVKYRQSQLLSANRTRLLGPFLDNEVTWNLGYWKSIQIDRWQPRFGRELRAAAEHPSARYLETVVFKDASEDNDDAIIAAAPALSHVAVRFEPPLDAARLGRMKAALPNLEVDE